jgi:hypothetical protein
MANTVIQLKWSDVSSAPASLNVGEAAYSNTSQKLYIGDTSNNVITVGGKFYVDQQGQIFTKTNLAFDTANSAGSYANAAFNFANTNAGAAAAGSYANSAFARANNSLDATTGGSITGSIGVTSNVYAGNVIANTAFTSLGGTTKLSLSDIGVVAISVAGETFGFGGDGIESNKGVYGGSFGGNKLSLNNETNLISNRYDTVKIQTGTTGTVVNEFVFANSSLTVPGGITANGFTAGGINVVPTLASSFSTANAAFARANNSINANTGGTITADLVVTGNLTVQGNTTYVNTQTITTGDSLIRLANNNTVGDTVDIGFYGAYNSSGVKYTGLVRQAGANYFLFKDLTSDPTSNVLAPGSLTAANTGTLTANLTSYSVTINGQDINLYTTNAYTQANTAATNALSAGSYANSAFLAANTPSNVANSAASYANAAFSTANSAFAEADSAASYANSAFATANNSSGVNLTQNASITAAFSHANAAFAQANTDYTTISTTAADYGTASAVAAFRIEANGRISSANSTAIAIAASAITSGTLGVARGGTGAGTFTNNGVLLGNGTGAFNTASSSTEGHILTINASGVPTFAMLSGGTF